MYQTLDIVDRELRNFGSPVMSELLELANLSSVVGNLVATGLAEASGGLYGRNLPHHFPDLIPLKPKLEGIELKVALETNMPKGHLPKPGNHVFIRYVLGDPSGNYVRGTRGNTVWVWEVRAGRLKSQDFSLSNTAGDSGKTAVLRPTVYGTLSIMYYDKSKVPYARVPTQF